MRNVRICKLERISNSPELANWYYAHLLIKCSTGNMMVKSSYFHKAFWMREFELSETDFGSIEVLPPFNS